MSSRNYVENLSHCVGETVAISGWVYTKRSSGKIRFIVLRDGTGLMQAVIVKSNVSEEVFNRFDELTQESSLRVTGKIRKEDRAPGGYEMDVSGLDIISIAKEYPITPKEHGVEFLMDRRHLWLRSERQHAILRVSA